MFILIFICWLICFNLKYFHKSSDLELSEDESDSSSDFDTWGGFWPGVEGGVCSCWNPFPTVQKSENFNFINVGIRLNV